MTVTTLKESKPIQVLENFSKEIVSYTEEKERLLQEIEAAENARSIALAHFIEKVREKAEKVKNASFLFLKQRAEADVLTSLFSLEQKGVLVVSVVIIPRRPVLELDISTIKSVLSALQIECGNIFNIQAIATQEHFELSVTEFAGVSLFKSQEGLPI